MLTVGLMVFSIAPLQAALTNAEEVAQLTTELVGMPAGSGLLGAAVLIFVVLVITDAMGATDIFTFVRPVH